MNINTIILVVSIIAILTVVMDKKTKPQKEEKLEKINTYPYEKKLILTKTEYKFYKELNTVFTPDKFNICPKMRMEDFLNVTDKQNLMKYRGYIKSRHIDFIICDKNLHMLAGIELDDKSHNTEKAIKTDDFKDNVFKKINIPLYRIKVAKSYNDEIKNIFNSLSQCSNEDIPEESKQTTHGLEI